LRKHSRHKQSSPSTGIGSFAVSSAHQQVPEKVPNVRDWSVVQLAILLALLVLLAILIIRT